MGVLDSGPYRRKLINLRRKHTILAQNQQKKRPGLPHNTLSRREMINMHIFAYFLKIRRKFGSSTHNLCIIKVRHMHTELTFGKNVPWSDCPSDVDDGEVSFGRKLLAKWLHFVLGKWGVSAGQNSKGSTTIWWNYATKWMSTITTTQDLEILGKWLGFWLGELHWFTVVMPDGLPTDSTGVFGLSSDNQVCWWLVSFCCVLWNGEWFQILGKVQELLVWYGICWPWGNMRISQYSTYSTQ